MLVARITPAIAPTLIEHMFAYHLEKSRHPRRSQVIQTAQFRVLGERNPRLEHRHGNRWARMDRTIPVLSDRQPVKAYRSTWICSDCGECVLHEWRAS